MSARVQDLRLISCSQLAHFRLATAGDSQEASTLMSSPSNPQATWPGVDYAVAYRHLANGTARFLIESRGRAPRRRSSRSGTLDPKQCLLELWSKREL